MYCAIRYRFCYIFVGHSNILLCILWMQSICFYTKSKRDVFRWFCHSSKTILKVFFSLAASANWLRNTYTKSNKRLRTNGMTPHKKQDIQPALNTWKMGFIFVSNFIFHILLLLLLLMLFSISFFRLSLYRLSSLSSMFYHSVQCILYYSSRFWQSVLRIMCIQDVYIVCTTGFCYCCYNWIHVNIICIMSSQ